MTPIAIQNFCMTELVHVFGESRLKGDANMTCHNVSFYFPKEALYHADQDRWRVILECKENTILFGGSVINSNNRSRLIRDMLKSMHYPIETEQIGNGPHEFEFYKFPICDENSLHRLLYTIIIPTIYQILNED